MKYLLIATLIFWGLSFWGYKAANRPGDDFGAAAPFLIALAVAVLLTVVCIALGFWNHRFL